MESMKKVTSMLHDKWIATITWAVLLLALVYTSGEVATVSLSMNFYGFDFPQSSGDMTLAMLTLVLFGVMLLFIVSAWLKFVSLTTEIYIQFADIVENDNVFENLVILSEVENEFDSTKIEAIEEVESTLISEVVKPMSVAWAVSIMTPALLSIASIFLR